MGQVLLTAFMEQLGKKHGRTIQAVCPTCGIGEAEWPQAGVVINETRYCCRGCAQGTGCICGRVAHEQARPVKNRNKYGPM